MSDFLCITLRRRHIPFLCAGVVGLTMLYGVAALSVASAPSASPSTPAIIASSSSAITIDARQTHQTLVGFGASTAFYQNWIAAHPNKQAVYDTFFRGLNLSILRLQNVYRPTKGPDFARADEDIVRGMRQAMGRDLPIMLTSWAPPAALKSNNDEKHGGTLARKNGAFAYEGFASYWTDSLAAYNKVGIRPTWVSIQNEPDWKADWESCVLKPRETTESGTTYAGYDKALAAVSSRLRALPAAPKMLGPETVGTGYNSVQNYLGPSGSVTVARLDGGIAHHLYSGGTHHDPDTFLPAMRALRAAYPNKPLWMTEFSRSDGFETAWCIHNTLTTEDAVAYVYWAGIWPGKDALINIDNPWQRGDWTLPNGFAATDRYYGLKHYSYFLGPGWKRVDATAGNTSVKVSAFISPDRSRLVAVALNTSTTAPKTLTLAVRGFALGQTCAAYRSILPPGAPDKNNVSVNGPGERFQSLGTIPTNGGVDLPPRALVTLVWDATH